MWVNITLFNVETNLSLSVRVVELVKMLTVCMPTFYSLVQSWSKQKTKWKAAMISAWKDISAIYIWQRKVREETLLMLIDNS